MTSPAANQRPRKRRRLLHRLHVAACCVNSRAKASDIALVLTLLYKFAR